MWCSQLFINKNFHLSSINNDKSKELKFFSHRYISIINKYNTIKYIIYNLTIIILNK